MICTKLFGLYRFLQKSDFAGCSISLDVRFRQIRKGKKSSEIGLLAKSDNSSEIEHSKLYIEIKNDLLTQCCLLAVLVSSTPVGVA